MTYVSLYRKWRPQTFSEVISQQHIIRTLQNALKMGRTAHAYLFSGPRGTGKTTVARLFAKALQCEGGPTPEPCDRCTSCVQIRDGVAMDVIEIDGASNRGIEEIRDLREKVKLVPVQAKYKVYIIDEIHMLTTDAFNALLKTLEEPPPHVVFIFATTEPHKIPATILSRCQRFDFKRLTVPELSSQLSRIATQEGLELSPETVTLIARNADGGLRDALSLLDQCIAFAGERITLEDVEALLGTVEIEVLLRFLDLVADRDLVAGLSYVGRLMDDGKDLHRLTRDLMGHLRNLLLLKLAPAMHLEAVEPELEERLRRQGERFSRDILVAGIEVLSEAESEIRWASQDRLPLELALIRLVGLVEAKADAAARPVAQIAAVQSAVQPATPEAAPVSRPAAAPPGELPTTAAAEPAAREPAAAVMAKAEELPEAGEHFPAPVSRTPAAGTSGFEQNWAEFLSHLGESGLKNMVSVFRQGDPPRLSGQTVFVEFAPNKAFYLKKATDNQEAMEKTVRRFFGDGFRFQPVTRGEAPPVDDAAGKEQAAAGESCPVQACSTPDAGEADEGTVAGAAEGDIRRDPLVRKAIELFGATLVRIEP